MTPSGTHSPKAIVCEDEAVTSARLAQQLEELGYAVVARPATGLEAVAAAREHRPELILMDIRMPGMDGLAAAAEIRPTVDATIVVITAHLSDEFIEQAVEAGVGGYLIKPVSPEQLRVAIALSLGAAARVRAAEHSAETARKQLADRKLIERAKGILMHAHGLPEHEAYRRIQKRSQDERRSMPELAAEIIHASEVLAAGDAAAGSQRAPDS
ncbi:MAG: response regulator [Armatimonadetes bacterium]|nr:response regulator [Armatimonadota bacterium]